MLHLETFYTRSRCSRSSGESASLAHGGAPRAVVAGHSWAQPDRALRVAVRIARNKASTVPSQLRARGAVLSRESGLASPSAGPQRCRRAVASALLLGPCAQLVDTCQRRPEPGPIWDRSPTRPRSRGVAGVSYISWGLRSPSLTQKRPGQLQTPGEVA